MAHPSRRRIAARIRSLLARATGARQSVPMPAWDYGSADVLACTVAYNRYGGFCVPLSSQHRPAAQRILRGDVWEEATLAYIAGACGSGDIVHAGTYFGDFLPALSASCGPGARIFAFEPNQENVRCADLTVRLNALENVDLRHAALGPSSGEARLATTDSQGRALGGASHLVDEPASAGLSDVSVVAVDEIVPADRSVSLIQLDVEGFEQHALEGSMQTIRRCRPLLILETVPSAEWVAEHLGSLGYVVERMIDANTVLRPM